jgi:hypothetical protein
MKDKVKKELDNLTQVYTDLAPEMRAVVLKTAKALWKVQKNNTEQENISVASAPLKTKRKKAE